MQSRIQKWGNSLALRIPISMARELGLDWEGLVDLSLEDGKLVVTPVGGTPTLEALLKQVSESNIHHEVDTGAPAGSEAW